MPPPLLAPASSGSHVADSLSVMGATRGGGSRFQSLPLILVCPHKQGRSLLVQADREAPALSFLPRHPLAGSGSHIAASLSVAGAASGAEMVAVGCGSRPFTLPKGQWRLLLLASHSGQHPASIPGVPLRQRTWIPSSVPSGPFLAAAVMRQAGRWAQGSN